ncbi:MAG: type II toxin-antitoxin system RelE/ParE family toxin [Cyanobacteria bacterium]|nr:type II toxin-antitoxin system RelE/ParE family toxin [Cyanobacteria bacterium CG_2015-16_32_12]NCO79450.1 type II toxin-antitoxin system RelE/ParE family toxin [Cyanobacteria bacterium CG_2015-22_32_23]NCQ03962.1 type II toxin-antitoxin system RelE/ParE family toxin [Cyanobacteria bacterium CG_2015-09_32_10]NCQ41463.1 type II toxin-antitoxin system RelE/ParE family toxin [Cyanobacteria bacterium CG_2015-04_32_10]NCS84291.1 type II toxin-antitoxin system RelE/ParE family toxin [Cyanobacteria
MKVKFESAFAKDLQKIKDRKLSEQIKFVILECKKAELFNQVKNVKKLTGYNNFYRIKIRDYRIGLEIQEDTIIFTRFLHRKDIYKYFP